MPPVIDDATLEVYIQARDQRAQLEELRVVTAERVANAEHIAAEERAGAERSAKEKAEFKRLEQEWHEAYRMEKSNETTFSRELAGLT